MRFSLPTVVALGALHTFGVYAQDCVNACIESVKPTVGCADATQAACICVSPDFVKGVSECARAPSCNAADADITSMLTNGFCTGQQVPALPEAAATPTSDVAATSEAAAATSETPAAVDTTDASETTGAVETSEAVSAPAVIPETSEAPEATPTDAAETAEPTATEASASATDANSSSATSEAAGAAPTSDSSEGETDKDENSSGGGMSSSAKAGVGIGITVGILALLGIAGFFFWKKRQNQGNSHGNMGGMSPPPMASRDRSYPSPDQGSIGEKHGYDLELMSHRYEDMLPREEPRHMV